jgi:prefoldin subunit 5
MQIEQIVIYSRDGRSRAVKLHLGKLNIITGVKRRGKSALLEIVDWCFGRSDFSVPEGRVRDACSWYGVLLAHGSQRTWLARPEAPAGVESPSGMMLVPRAPDEPPPASDLAVNSDRRAVREHLNALLGIEEGEIPREEHRLKPALHISSAHAVPLCLQNQDEIASKTLLFHRQHDSELTDDLQAALPYFLGAVDPDTPRLRSELRRARRDLTRAQRHLELGRTAAKHAETRAAELLREASAAGLPTEGEEEPLLLLQAAVEAPASLQIDARDDSRSAELVRERRAVAAERRQVERRIALLRQFGREVEDFGIEAGAEAARLRSMDLLPNPNGLADGHACPACNRPLDEPDPTTVALMSAVEGLDAELGEARRIPVRTRAAVEELSERLEELDDRLREIGAALKDLENEGDRVAREGDLGRARAFVQGRIAEYVRLAERSRPRDLETQHANIHALERQIASLEARLDSEREQDEVDARLDAVSEAMTRYGRALDLEHVEPPATLRLHLGRMTTFARTPTGAKWLPTIGSGSNWVGYHLATHLGLHNYFTHQSRPVPRFLMLDQPTQAFYPEDVPPGQTVPSEDLDREDVLRLFRVLYDAVAELGGRFQLIVCDHAKLTEYGWFMESIAHDWRAADGLVPEDWPGPQP